MVLPRLLQQLDQAFAESESSLDRECLKAERVVAMARLGMMVESRMALAQVKAQLKRQTEPRLQGWATYAEAVLTYTGDHHEPSIRGLFAQAKQFAVTAGDQTLQAQTSVWLASLDFQEGLWTSFADELIWSMPELCLAPSARLELLMARAYSYAGKPEQSAGYYRAAHRLAALDGDTAMIGAIISTRMTFQADALALEDAFGRCAPEAARRVMIEVESSVNFNAGIGKADRVSWNPMLKAMVCMAMKRYDEATALLETHMRNAMADGLGTHSAYFHAARAWCLWQVGEHEAARRDLTVAREHVADMPDPDDLAATHARIAVMLGQMGQPIEAAQHQREAEKQLQWLTHSQAELCIQLSRVESERARLLQKFAR